MPNITIRDIPDDVFEKIKILSKTDRRSINSEILLLLENGLKCYLSSMRNISNHILARQSQLEIWNNLLGKWEDNRNTDEIVNDIYANRTKGRDIEL